jgi:menaquinone-specific isochorismate synthase
MIYILNSDPRELGLEEAKSFFLNEFRRLDGAGGNMPPRPFVIRLVTRIIPVSLSGWLACQDLYPRIFWKDRDSSLTVAGAGAAYDDRALNENDKDEVWSSLDCLLDADPQGELRFFSGMSFHPVVTGGEWQEFSSFRVVLPRFEIMEKDRMFFLACNVVVSGTAGLSLRHISAEIACLHWQEDISSGKMQAVSCVYEPDYEGWHRSALSALAAIRGGDMEKVVLARKTVVSLDTKGDPYDFLCQVLGEEMYGDVFLFQFSALRCFLGVSPEILFARHRDALASEAIAGTRGRSDDQHEDEALSSDLLHSDKEKLEHQLVVNALVSAFRQVCRSYRVDAASPLLKLKDQQHLITRLAGRLAGGVSDRELADLFHPTPAVGGEPSLKAMNFLYQHEVFDRGWFAGPVGYISRHETKLAVAIRSVLFDGMTINLFSGAGIVQGSDPCSEWHESGQKIKGFLDIICSPQGGIKDRTGGGIADAPKESRDIK